MTEETKRKINQGAQIHGFIPRQDEKDEKQQYRQEVINKFADYLVNEWKEL